MTSLDQTLHARLQHLDTLSLRRRLRTVEQADGVRVKVDGRWLISFGSNDYLGLAGLPQVETIPAASGSTGSRLTTGSHAAHAALEAELASFKHTEAAIVFSSGYAANVGTIPALVGDRDLILSDQLNHASLIDGCRLSRAERRIYRHNDIEHVRTLLEDRAAFQNVLVVTDGVFSMDGDIAPLPELVDLCDQFGCWLMVDDAHGTGVFGETGAGVIEEFGLSDRVPVQMGTLSKSIGAAGGFVAGSQVLIDWLRNKARSFVFSTAAAPAEIEAARRSLTTIRESPSLRQQLHANISRMRGALKELNLPVLPGRSPIIPLIIGQSDHAMALSHQIEELGLWIPAIRPPTVPNGSSRLRITVTAAHTTSQIDQAVEAITKSIEAMQ